MTNIDDKADRWFKQSDQPLSANFDPSTLNDPVAMLTKWEPCEESCTPHKLVRRGQHRIEFRSTLRTSILLGAFILLGLILFLGAVYNLISGTQEKFVASIMVAILGLAVASGVFAALLSQLTPLVFDLRHGCYYKGRTKPDRTAKLNQRKGYVPLDRIHALQIIEQHQPSRGRRIRPEFYFVYELNLILEDGSRTRVTSRVEGDPLRKDARSLSKFLNKPLWDPTVNGGD